MTVRTLYGWVASLAAPLLPAAAFLSCALPLLPESPRWLVLRGQPERAAAQLSSLRTPKHDVQAEVRAPPPATPPAPPSSSYTTLPLLHPRHHGHHVRHLLLHLLLRHRPSHLLQVAAIAAAEAAHGTGGRGPSWRQLLSRPHRRPVLVAMAVLALQVRLAEEWGWAHALQSTRRAARPS